MAKVSFELLESDCLGKDLASVPAVKEFIHLGFPDVSTTYDGLESSPFQSVSIVVTTPALPPVPAWAKEQLGSAVVFLQGSCMAFLNSDLAPALYVAIENDH